MKQRPRLHNRVNKEELKEALQATTETRLTLSFYRYAHIKNPTLFRDHLYLLLDQIGVKGRIYVAEEGINGQISVAENDFEHLKKALYSIDFLDGIRLNIAIDDDGKSFYVLKIQIKNKIVADGLDDDTFDPTDIGTHLTAAAFNEITSKPDTIIVDMRNHYESEVGYFEGAITPDVATFREALPIAEEILKGQEDKNIVLYCTGGIRCEKASAYYKHRGFQNVYQLEGGIIEYTRKAKELGIENKFKGVNFVFDERLGERISEDVIAKCHQCGEPCDTHRNCGNDACHLLFIQCPTCAAKYNNCCSQKCSDFIQLPEATQYQLRKTEVFNGTKFGKGRYRANKEKMLS